jgi:hypothetical protein
MLFYRLDSRFSEDAFFTGWVHNNLMFFSSSSLVGFGESR